MIALVDEAAHEWRIMLAGADRARDDLIAAVKSAHSSGMSEYQLAAAAGVTRATIRAWLGK